jgi:hypothetical protein
VLGFPLTEELKWGVPCYTYENTAFFAKIDFHGPNFALILYN